MTEAEQICMMVNKPKPETDIEVGDILQQGSSYYEVLSVQIEPKEYVEPVVIRMRHLDKVGPWFRRVYSRTHGDLYKRNYYPGVYDVGDNAPEQPMVKVVGRIGRTKNWRS